MQDQVAAVKAVAEAEARARDLGQVVAPVRAVVAGKVEE